MKLEFTNYDDKLGFRVSVQNAESLVIDGKPYKCQKEARWFFEEEWSPSTPDGPAECEWAGWVCGNCREFPTDDDWDDPDAPPKMEFCPHCGYKMHGSAAVSRVSTPFGKPVMIAVEKSMEDIKNTDDENKTFDGLIWD